MASQKDVFDSLDNEWFTKAQEANKWKEKFASVDVILDILDKQDPENDKLPQQFESSPNTLKIYKLLLKWLNDEKHVFTRAKILQLLPIFINSIPRDQLPHSDDLATIISTKLFVECRQTYWPQIKSLLIKLWLRTNFSLITPGFVDGLISMMNHRKRELREIAFDFLKICTFFPQRKMNIIDFIIFKQNDGNDNEEKGKDKDDENENVQQLILRTITKHKFYNIRISAAKVFHGLISTLQFKQFNNKSIVDIVSIMNEAELIRASKDYKFEKDEFFEDEEYFPPNKDNDENKENDDEFEEKIAASNHTDSTSKYDASRIFKEIESETQLHIWDSQNAAWIPLKKALQTQTKRKIVTKSMMISKKFGGLDPAEILMYQSIETHCNDTWELSMPHDLLMVILLYSQGYKFEKNDECIYFPSGIFSMSLIGSIQDILEDKVNKNNYKYLCKAYRGGGPVRVPFNHVFGNKIVIIDIDGFKNIYDKYPKLEYGDVLKVLNLKVVEEEVYSKKKKRNIRKMKLMMICKQMVDTKWRPRGKKGNYEWLIERKQEMALINQWSGYGRVEIMWDANIFVQAKWKRIDT